MQEKVSHIDILDEWEEGPCDRKKTVQRKNTRKSMSVRKDDALFG